MSKASRKAAFDAYAAAMAGARWYRAYDDAYAAAKAAGSGTIKRDADDAAGAWHRDTPEVEQARAELRGNEDLTERMKRHGFPQARIDAHEEYVGMLRTRVAALEEVEHGIDVTGV